jgi:hypothetical protein
MMVADCIAAESAASISADLAKETNDIVILSPIFGRRTSVVPRVVSRANYGGSSPKNRAQNDSATSFPASSEAQRYI